MARCRPGSGGASRRRSSSTRPGSPTRTPRTSAAPHRRRRQIATQSRAPCGAPRAASRTPAHQLGSMRDHSTRHVGTRGRASEQGELACPATGTAILGSVPPEDPGQPSGARQVASFAPPDLRAALSRASSRRDRPLRRAPSRRCRWRHKRRHPPSPPRPELAAGPEDAGPSPGRIGSSTRRSISCGS